MKVVTFGEIMLRLKSPGYDRLFQSPVLEATFGGGEANVAVSLANFGMDARFVTVLPDNAIGDACLRELRGFGVDTSCIVRKPGRMGIYYLETGAVQRAKQGDLRPRAGSAIAEAKAVRYRLGKGVCRRGLVPHHRHHARDQRKRGGTEPGGRESGQASCGMHVSCDLNYRKNLWKYGKTADQVMTELVQIRRYHHRQRRGFPKIASAQGRKPVRRGNRRAEH